MNGILWSALERFSTQGIQFVIGLVLARLLSPSDYGMVGMLAIFIALSQTFVDGGFSLALIQKNNCTENDFSTVFYFNIIIGVVIYGILFISAPYIERFYDLPGLVQPPASRPRGRRHCGCRWGDRFVCKRAGPRQ